jgi:hypothetical protein
MGNLATVNEALDSIDLKQIAMYTRKLADIGSDFNKMMAASYARDFIVGYDIASTMLAKTVQSEIQAKNALEEAEAIAFLDDAPAYFAAKNEKPTVESKKAYVSLNANVKEAKDTLARATAMCSLLKSKVIEFRDAISIIKMLQSDGYMSKWEGMNG